MRIIRVMNYQLYITICLICVNLFNPRAADFLKGNPGYSGIRDWLQRAFPDSALFHTGGTLRNDGRLYAAGSCHEFGQLTCDADQFGQRDLCVKVMVVDVRVVSFQIDAQGRAFCACAGQSEHDA